MQRFREYEEIDYFVIGVGAAVAFWYSGLPARAFSVVGFEAGPFWDTERDWVSDEAGSHQPVLERNAHYGRRRPTCAWCE